MAVEEGVDVLETGADPQTCFSRVKTLNTRCR